MKHTDKTTQFIHENNAWKRLLDFFIQENSLLKNRLSEVVDKQMDKAFIADAELFQNEFLLKDEYIHDLWNDLTLQGQNLSAVDVCNAAQDGKIRKRQEKLRNEMAYLEKEFSNLKAKFNHYIHSHA